MHYYDGDGYTSIFLLPIPILAQVTFESIDPNDVVGGAINVLQDDVDFSGNQLHVISLVMIIDIENGNTSSNLNGSVVIDFAMDLTVS